MSIITRTVVALAIAGSLAVTGIAGAATAGQYGGTTSQKVGGSALRIDLTVGDGALTNVTVDANANRGGAACALNGEAGNSFDFDKGTLRIDRRGTFEGKLTDASGESITISGRFTAESVAGSFEISGRGEGQQKATCSSGRVTFDATAAGGEVAGDEYSGSVGPGYPITFRVSPNGSAIVDMVVAIEATCQPGAGSVAPSYDLKTLAITAGTFSGSVFSQHSTVSDSVRITGTFFGRTAVGEVSDLSHIKSLPDCTDTEPFTATAK